MYPQNFKKIYWGALEIIEIEISPFKSNGRQIWPSITTHNNRGKKINQTSLGSFLTVTTDCDVSEGSYGTGLGEGGGSAAAGGVNASAILDTSGVGSGNGSGQSAQLVIIPLPPLNATVNATVAVKFVDRAGRFFFPYYGSIGGYAYGGPYGAYRYGGYPYGYYGGYYGQGK